MGWFEGRVAVVTGAASGLGRAVAERIAAEGGAVVVADIAGDRAQETAAAIEADGGRASGFAVDVSEEAQVAAMVAHTLATFGRLDVLHNNAAALGPEVILRGQRDRRHGRRRVGPHAGGEPARGDARVQARDPGDARPGWWRDREHDVGQRARR